MHCIICDKYNNNDLMDLIHYGEYERVLANINISILNNDYDILNDVYCKYCNFEDTILTSSLNTSSKRPFNTILDIIIKRIIECKKSFTLYEMTKLKKNKIYYDYFFNKRIKSLQDDIYKSNINIPIELINHIFEFTVN